MGLIYFSHIPIAIISLFIGFFVLFRNKELVSRILFSMSVTFSLWVFFDFLLWEFGYNSQLAMLSWSLLSLLFSLFFVLSLYFFYVFIEKRDISFFGKIFFAMLLAPVVILFSTSLNLAGFDVRNCEPTESKIFISYVYFLGVAVSILIPLLLLFKYKKFEKKDRKQILILTLGIELALFAFSWSNIIGSLTLNWELIQIGLFSMPVFLGTLVYLIVRYQAFNIKLIGAQALVLTIIILIGSQFFFIRNTTNQILTGFTLALAVVFGYVLVRSVKLEIQRKEELQRMTEELAVANDNLRKLDNAKSEFISIASHQLRTPLTAIKGYLSLLLEGSYGKIKPDHKDVINKVYQSNERLINLVEELLNLSRIESGRMEYDYVKVDILEVCQELCDTFILRAREKGLELKLENPREKMPEVMTDKGKIREIISNLVDNAIKYTLKGGVKIAISLENNFVRVSIVDSGIGVPKSDLPFLFQKFSRGKDISRLNTSGTGLGLHVGKTMIESMGGTIGVDSEGEGKGSTFWVEVPVDRVG